MVVSVGTFSLLKRTCRLLFINCHIQSTVRFFCTKYNKNVIFEKKKKKKGRDINRRTKVCLFKAMVSQVVMYGCESWTPVHPWQIHVDVWRNQHNTVKFKKKERKNDNFINKYPKKIEKEKES